eukprot:CAMPEP_0114426742 /NCGR_PEP_ID=MMETSP0103-20121206/7963_1 /TAXON_ID=37642 ORGANISM="Paraphysomonas imperforata, Strain PA2" /NCGR_SAMPLE_ID=MMETSP0103 /ASSEMBLY_ACC=CAM_ASM_000201 /LENGTH=602 /DNA_ID=CAMNT_0001595729 /DNA_START=383 /DNA_END=2191 /DNA_ORIENTATION=+
MSVKQVLSGRAPNIFTIDHKASIREAINHLVTKKLSSSLILDGDKQVAGIVTARDLLRFVNDVSSLHIAPSTRAVTSTTGLNAFLTHKVTEVMKPVERMIYCSPKDTVKHCREIMFQMKIRHMPVLENSAVVGIVTMSDLSDAEFNNALHGGKKGYISNVIGRKGLPRGTRVLGHPSAPSDECDPFSASFDEHECAIQQQQHVVPAMPLSRVRSGSFTLPHPFKTSDSVAGSRRQYGPDDLCEDNDLNEDAHFVMTVQLPNLLGRTVGSAPLAHDSADQEVGGGEERRHLALEQVYACVADGVGSWRQHGVDPRLYSHRLVENAKSVIRDESARRMEDYILYEASHRGEKGVDVSAASEELVQGDETVHPLDALFEAWYMTNKDQDIIGSSTICVATIDLSSNQLSYSNVGDGGLMVVRHVPRDGTLNAKIAPTTHTTQTSYNNTNYKIAYLAQQQLRSFNFPFQLGNGGGQYEGVFEQPVDADTASIPLMPGDVVVLASDGLFDNLEISEIIAIISEWEQEEEQVHGGSGDEEARVENSSYDGRCQALARSLVVSARAASLSKDKDSPFALLAKENDIMWGGGMPDDTTVVIMQLTHPEKD